MKTRKYGINSFCLHLFAMAAMLCDHLWATVCSSWWLTFFGRMAFPIFAFLLVEGFYHSHDYKKYCIRLLGAGLISEIPFNLMYGGTILYPYHQNIMWTLLLGLLGMMAAEKLKEKKIIGWALGVCLFFALSMVSLLCMLDFYNLGIIIIMVFYYFHGDEWWKKLLQIAGIFYANVILWGGMVMDIILFGQTFEASQQGFAVFSMIPILLYNGQQGPHGKGMQAFYYLFYPAHMLVLSLISLYII